MGAHVCAGPGLAVRVLGDVTEGDALDVLRQVDEIYVNAIREFGLYDEIWQAFAVFLPIRCDRAAASTGVGNRKSRLCVAQSALHFLQPAELHQVVASMQICFKGSYR